MLKDLIEKKHKLDSSKKIIDDELSKVELSIDKLTKYKDNTLNNLTLFEDLRELINMQEAFSHKAYPVISAMCGSKCSCLPENERFRIAIKDKICPFACICEYIRYGVTDISKEGVKDVLSIKQHYKKVSL